MSRKTAARPALHGGRYLFSKGGIWYEWRCGLSERARCCCNTKIRACDTGVSFPIGKVSLPPAAGTPVDTRDAALHAYVYQFEIRAGLRKCGVRHIATNKSSSCASGEASRDAIAGGPVTVRVLLHRDGYFERKLVGASSSVSSTRQTHAAGVYELSRRRTRKFARVLGALGKERDRQMRVRVREPSVTGPRLSEKRCRTVRLIFWSGESKTDGDAGKGKKPMKPGAREYRKRQTKGDKAANKFRARGAKCFNAASTVVGFESIIRRSKAECSATSHTWRGWSRSGVCAKSYLRQNHRRRAAAVGTSACGAKASTGKVHGCTA
ncbi:unnamed protein product [Rangifer tarandus platyrhynchus]|uniref:Uncharacterized protein n=1 Tax=Rangifer tarandus platyrhynchus TaxID=3082113 RepID=A0ABN8XMX0_RANTA|nr:unnamed protein product [Rangifer tarandus platyrhynchus]